MFAHAHTKTPCNTIDSTQGNPAIEYRQHGCMQAIAAPAAAQAMWAEGERESCCLNTPRRETADTQHPAISASCNQSIIQSINQCALANQRVLVRVGQLIACWWWLWGLFSPQHLVHTHMHQPACSTDTEPHCCGRHTSCHSSWLHRQGGGGQPGPRSS